MPANDRMDWLIEKATELGAASIQPLMSERSVLRLKGERADKKLAHWRAVAVAACEQCGRNRVPEVHPVMSHAGRLAQGEHCRSGRCRGQRGCCCRCSPARRALAMAVQRTLARRHVSERPRRRPEPRRRSRRPGLRLCARHAGAARAG